MPLETGAGDLSERVALDAPTSADDGHGGVVGAFETRFTVWAEYVRLRGGEAVIASRLEGRRPTVIRVRASADTRTITTDWRARDARTGEIFNLRSVEPTSDRRFIDLLAESGVAT